MRNFKTLMKLTFLAGVAYSAIALADAPTSYNMSIQNGYNPETGNSELNFVSKFPTNSNYYCPPPVGHIGYHEATTPFTFNVNCQGGQQHVNGPVQMSVAYQLTASDLPQPLTCTVDYTWDGSTCVATLKKSEEQGPATCKVSAESAAGACNFDLQFFNNFNSVGKQGK